MVPSVAALFRPRSIAVIGATNRKDSLGGRLTSRLFAAGFTGAIYPINPKQAAVHSTHCYKSILDVPGPVDLAVIIVPRAGALATTQECCQKGVKGICLITAGFGEVDAEGRKVQEEIAALCRRHGIRMLGPNCMGLINTHPDYSIDATFSPTPALTGPIAFGSQSGALGVAVLNICQERAIGFSQFISLGNKADVTENDLLEAWENDPEVPVITMYLESFADPDRYLELARRITPQKPIVLVKAGRTEAGARAASSHTGALAAADTGAEALCRQAGILRAGTVEEMLDVAMILSRCPVPAGNRVAILTNAGGPGILCADACSDFGLNVTPLAPETQARLRAILPPEAAVGNPVDMVASASPANKASCLEVILDDPGIDAVITIQVTPPMHATTLDYLKAIQPVLAQAQKPVASVFMAGEEFYSQVRHLPGLPPIFPLPESAAKALAAAIEYGRRRALPAPAFAPSAADDDAIAALIQKQKAAGGGYLGAADTFRVLELAGLPVAPWRVVSTPDEAVAGAEAVGFPVVLKAVDGTIIHKSDIGGVALNIKSPVELRAALDRMDASLCRAGMARGSWSWLVQAFRPGGREVIIGASHDHQYGPLVMFGLGGKYVEVFRDVQFALTPLSRQDAEEMVRSIKGFKLLAGTRGEAGVELEPAVSAIERVAHLVRRHPAIAELDLNPLLLYPEKGKAVAVDGRIRVE